MKANNALSRKYPHVYRKKSIWELIRLSTAVMGIEFAYSAETAFVSPLLLELGVDHDKLIAMWAISPVLGFFLTPLMGMLSDRCTLEFGRRRPFILILSLGLLMGILFVPCGKNIGTYLGEDASKSLPTIAITITIIGTVLMDLNADICQSPIRAYLLEVTIPDDYAKGLSMFTLTAGVGGFIGYTFGAIDWESVISGTWTGGNVKFIFLSVAILFVICVALTVTSFKEIPIGAIRAADEAIYVIEDIIPDVLRCDNADAENGLKTTIHNESDSTPMKKYLKSIVVMPKSMIILYVTHLLTWMSHLSYVLYFTDFVGESVFRGDPSALQGTKEYDIYNEGVRFGCWGLAVYAISCAFYSFVIEHLIKKFKTRLVYIAGFLAYALGMGLLALIKTRLAVLLSSITAGIAYSTLFNIPYLIIARYHLKGNGDAFESVYSARGVGTDMAIIGSTVFVAQLTLSLGLGAITNAVGSISTTIWAASILSVLAAISATQIIYLDI